jgi:hypothetical protein
LTLVEEGLKDNDDEGYIYRDINWWKEEFEETLDAYVETKIAQALSKHNL